MIIIKEGDRSMVMKNVLTVEPDDQQRVAEQIAKSLQKVVEANREASAAVLTSTDGTRVLNYILWQSAEALHKMRQALPSPSYVDETTEITKLLTADLAICTLCSVHSAGATRGEKSALTLRAPPGTVAPINV